MVKIYGVDPAEPITPENVRDEIVRCFEQAHDEFMKKSLKDVTIDFGEETKDKFAKANIGLSFGKHLKRPVAIYNL